MDGLEAGEWVLVAEQALRVLGAFQEVVE